jgi:diaminopimelate epimerase
MKIAFHKYHGTGNDFILIDNRQVKHVLSKSLISLMCDRHFGIGADGLILLTDAPGFDFGMVYFNSDGNESTMCGNGGRCITAFASALGIIGESAHFLAMDGEHRSFISKNTNGTTQVRLQMKDVTSVRSIDGNFFLDTGSPHYVVFSHEVEDLDVLQEGKKLRNSEMFAPHGTNVNFVEKRGDRLFIRTFERGVENETLSCGTGVTAASIASVYNSAENSGFVEVTTPGGDLCVSFNRDRVAFTDVWLEGPTVCVFEGEWKRGRGDEGRGTRDEGRSK